MIKRLQRFKTLPKRSKWRIVGTYALFQVPNWLILIGVFALLRQWIHLPSWVFWGVGSFWIAKDVLMFSFVWRGYEPSPPGAAYSLIRAEGVAEGRLNPSGYIRVRGELWRAEVTGKRVPVEKGERVLIVGVKGLTLFVQPVRAQTKEGVRTG